MGKYMRKVKISGEVAVMEVSHQSSFGVRTRAKTLALQRLQNTPDSSSYLELRSRRLEKPLVSPASAKPKENCKEDHNPNPSNNHSPRCIPNPNRKASSRFAVGVNSGSVSVRSCSKEEEAVSENEGGVEVSFGENVLEVEARERNIRETTPCSLIRDSETIGTPGSTTRPTNSTATNRRIRNVMHRNIPTAHEMEEFFAGAEQHQQTIFIDKYNYDPVNDHPLPGRYEWVRLGS